MNDTILMEKAMKCLIQNLGEVDTERFIVQIIREPFDYTKWQQDLFNDMSIEEISNAAAKYCEDNPR